MQFWLPYFKLTTFYMTGKYIDYLLNLKVPASLKHSFLQFPKSNALLNLTF